jgi:hypothetical protein
LSLPFLFGNVLAVGFNRRHSNPYARAADPLIAEIQTALREQGALIDATICPMRLPCNTRDFDFDLAKKNIGRVTSVNDRRLARAVLWSKNASSTAALE